MTDLHCWHYLEGKEMVQTTKQNTHYQTEISKTCASPHDNKNTCATRSEVHEFCDNLSSTTSNTI